MIVDQREVGMVFKRTGWPADSMASWRNLEVEGRKNGGLGRGEQVVEDGEGSKQGVVEGNSEEDVGGLGSAWVEEDDAEDQSFSRCSAAVEDLYCFQNVNTCSKYVQHFDQT